jgi:hypothetical protein
VLTGAIRLICVTLALVVVRAELRRVMLRSEGRTRAQRKRTNGDECHD